MSQQRVGGGWECHAQIEGCDGPGRILKVLRAPGSRAERGGHPAENRGRERGRGESQACVFLLKINRLMDFLAARGMEERAEHKMENGTGRQMEELYGRAFKMT